MAQLFTAQLDSYELNILDISDNIAASLIKHEFVGTDGAIIQNMGNHAREVVFRTYWFGNLILNTGAYGLHFAFINEMTDSSISHILVHPKYGRVEGYVESLTMIHDDTQDYVAIDVKFVQKDIQNEKFVAPSTASIIQNKLIVQAQNELANSTAQLQTLYPELIGKTIDLTKSLQSQFANVSAKTKAFMQIADNTLNVFDSFLNTVNQPLNTLDSAIGFVNDVPSRIIGSMNNCLNRIIGSLAKLSNSPVQFINNMVLNIQNLERTIVDTPDQFFTIHFKNIASGTLINQSSKLMITDENNSQLQKSIEGKNVFDIAGNRIVNVVPENIMTRNDLDNLLFQIRTYVQSAIVLDRYQQNLKEMTMNLTDYINNIKLNRQIIKTITVNNMPLHMLCLQLGLPYNAADRILKLNHQIHNPNFVEGQVQVYVN